MPKEKKTSSSAWGYIISVHEKYYHIAMAWDIFNTWKSDLKVEKPSEELSSQNSSAFVPKHQPDYDEKKKCISKERAVVDIIGAIYDKNFKFTT